VTVLVRLWAGSHSALARHVATGRMWMSAGRHAHRGIPCLISTNSLWLLLPHPPLLAQAGG
jgi:hypothetical protein